MNFNHFPNKINFLSSLRTFSGSAQESLFRRGHPSLRQGSCSCRPYCANRCDNGAATRPDCQPRNGARHTSSCPALQYRVSPWFPKWWKCSLWRRRNLWRRPKSGGRVGEWDGPRVRSCLWLFAHSEKIFIHVLLGVLTSTWANLFRLFRKFTVANFCEICKISKKLCWENHEIFGGKLTKQLDMVHMFRKVEFITQAVYIGNALEIRNN